MPGPAAMVVPLSSRSIWLALGVGLLGLSNRASAGDWPQILGPARNGQAVDEPVIGAWGADGPGQAWSYPLGEGYAGPAVIDERVVVFHRLRDVERVECLAADSGKQLWSRDFPASYRGGVNPDTGPRCVPVIQEGRVFLFGAAGDLHCVALADGRQLWSRNLYDRFDAQEGYFGAGSTPIVVGDLLLVNVGGRGAGLVALRVDDGETRWTATREGASYSSPTRTRLGGRPAVIFVTRLNTVAVDPQDGQLLFRFPFGRRGPTVNGATPLVFGDRLFVSAAYGVGARLMRIQADGAEPIWSNDEVMSSQYTTCVHHQGYLYGTDGREDYGNGELRCVEAETGKLQWTVPGTGVGHVILVGTRLLFLSHTGQLVLAEASPLEFTKLAETRLSDDTCRALPALAGGHFYFRDNRGRSGRLHCVELAGVDRAN